MLTKENFLPSCQSAMKMNSLLDDVLDFEQIVKDANKVHRIVFPELYEEDEDEPARREG